MTVFPTRTTLVALALGAIALLAACGDESDNVEPVSIFDGSGDFYDVPDLLPTREPGALIRVEPLSVASDEDRVTLRVMYHTRDSQDRDVAATGIVTYPLAALPDEGWNQRNHFAGEIDRFFHPGFSAFRTDPSASV